MKEFICQISGFGHLPGQTHRAFDDLVRSLAGKAIKITVALYQKRRSNNQNAYYWSVVIPAITGLFRGAGNDYDDEDTHEYLKVHIGKLRRATVLPDGTVKMIPGSTKRLTKPEMEDYLQKCRAFAAENGVAIALPNEELIPPIEAYTTQD